MLFSEILQYYNNLNNQALQICDNVLAQFNGIISQYPNSVLSSFHSGEILLLCIIYYIVNRHWCHDFLAGFGHDLDGNKYIHTTLWLGSLISLLCTIYTQFNQIVNNTLYLYFVIIEAVIIIALFIDRELAFNQEASIGYMIHEISCYLRLWFGTPEITDKNYDQLTVEEQIVVMNHEKYKMGYDEGYSAGLQNNKYYLYDNPRFADLSFYVRANGFYNGKKAGLKNRNK